MNFKNLALGSVVALFLVGCGKDDNNTPAPEPTLLQEVTHKNVIKAIAEDVIIATYKDMDEKADALKVAIRKFAAKGGQTQANLDAVKNAWKGVRSAWEQSEGFLYGPVAFKGLDPAMDSWPVDIAGMNNIIDADATFFAKFSEDENGNEKIDDNELNTDITVNVVANNNGTRGFHLIEFLLWGDRGDRGQNPEKPLADFIPNTNNAEENEKRERILGYLVSAVQDLKNNTAILYEDWSSEDGGHVKIFLTAGEAENLKYTSATAVYEQFVEGMVGIADEVGAVKIANAYNGGTPKLEDEESRFSKNSTTDFLDNIKSIENVYLGQYNGKDVLGISDVLVKNGKTELDNKVKKAINDAKNDIQAMGDFTKTLFNEQAKVRKAMETVASLKELLEGEFSAYIKTLR